MGSEMPLPVSRRSAAEDIGDLSGLVYRTRNQQEACSERPDSDPWHLERSMA